MRSSNDDERAAFLADDPTAPGSPPQNRYTDDALVLEATPGADRIGNVAKPEPYQQPHHRRRRWCGIRHIVSSICSSNRRSKRRCLGLALKLTLAFIFALFAFTPIFAPSYLHPPAHYQQLARQCDERQKSATGEGAQNLNGCANPFHENVFISVSLYDKDGNLADGQWGQALIDLIHLIGPNNVFVSIYENDSGKAGATALDRLRRRLPSRSSVVYEDHVPVDIFPNITMPDGSVRTKRLAYLSEMRNRALRPLDTYGGVDFMTFDRVLFLNDVAFRPLDAAQLLFSTNVDSQGRAQYLSACTLDWKHPYLFYDVYAQRDAEGFSNGVPIFPIFSGAGKGLSRSDMLARKDAVRVQSCWGGMVATKAEYVQNLNATLPRPDFQDIGSHVIDPVKPTAVVSPVRFRYEPELFIDACECCLFHADIAQAARAAGATKAELGVYVNPYIRVAYDFKSLGQIPWVQRWERLFSIPQAIITHFTHLPTPNPHRLVKEGEPFVEEVWSTEANAWRLETRTGRSGMFCGVREMQLIQQGPRKGDKNWANTAIPPGQTLNFPT